MEYFMILSFLSILTSGFSFATRFRITQYRCIFNKIPIFPSIESTVLILLALEFNVVKRQSIIELLGRIIAS